MAIDPHPGDSNDALSQNGYTYVKNSPVMNVDPNGDFALLGIYFIPVIGEYALAGTLIFVGGCFAARGAWYLGRTAKDYFLKSERSKDRIGRRITFNTRKKAKEAAKRKAKKQIRADRNQGGKKRPHYHPDDSHDHYFFPKRRW